MCRLRPARPEDAELVWRWANDPAVRAMAFTSEPILWDAHAAWYAAKLADPRCRVAILETTDGVPLGQIRFDEGPQGLEVDVSVASMWRGQGLGRVLLTQGLEAAARRWPMGTSVVAKILIDNQASVSLFERCGFIRKGTDSFQGKRFHWLERVL